MTSLPAFVATNATLPIIDMEPLRSGNGAARRAVANRIRAACIDKGFFYVTGHGVPEAMMEDVLAQARRFFALPLEQKMAVDVAKSFCHRGYEPMKIQTLEPGSPPDFKEGFSFDRNLPLDHPLVVARTFGCGPNQWPENLPEWRENLEAYERVMREVSVILLRGLALSLDLPEDFFAEFSRDASCIVRLIHYPPQPASPLPGEKGCGAHTDWGAITFLLQDDVGGLQVQEHGAGWIDASPIRGTFVVNIGDMLARWTNDLYKSTQHRVINASGLDRVSVPFFYMGRLDYTVQCIPGRSSATEPAKYPPTTPAEHLQKMANLTFRSQAT